MKLCITVDVERDPSTFRTDNPTFRNVLEGIPRILGIASEVDAVVTLFVTGEAAGAAMSAVSNFDSSLYEVGVHCHPGYQKVFLAFDSKHSKKLARYTGREQKLLIEEDKKIVDSTFGLNTTTYRSGKLSKNWDTMQALKQLGFTFDSSEMTPVFSAALT